MTITQPSATQLTVTQSSQSAVVNYQSFSVGQGSSVNFVQPNASSAILNRVTGAASSTIAGSINANGIVYLVNPNGIAITKSGTVNTGGGFVASTLGITDSDFMAGKRGFTGNGASADVGNAGTIRVGRGGYAALIGGTVSNSGSIDVPLGKVGLGSGERATLDFSGDGFLQVAMPTAAETKGALVRNSGSIRADGGSIVISAATARETARNAINISGMVQARSISGHNGAITIGGGDGGRVRITGRLIATSHRHVGGAITVTGRTIKLKGATVDASGRTGGGTIRIGGDRQGQGALQRAAEVSIDKTTTIKADARATGNGGNVVVWSDTLTRFAGTISAKGGAGAGNGGEAEVSSHGVLGYAGFTDLSAAHGAYGNLLLDPYNVTISTGASSNQSGFTASGNNSVINSATLLTALGSANVTISTGAAGSQAGDITLAAATPLAWSTGATLSLQAAGAITLNSDITAAAGGLTLSSGGTITPAGAVSVARFTLAAGDWVQNDTFALPGFAAGDFQVTGGSFLRAAGGDGTAGTPYVLTDIYGVQGMGTSDAYRTANYQLANDIDAAGTAAWNGGAGFNPVGNADTPFTGNLDGAGHTISGLTIARPSQDYVGLIGALNLDVDGNNSSVSGLGLVGGSVSGRDYVGGLVGANGLDSGGMVSQSYATGSVMGRNFVGGLAGYNHAGTVGQSYASGSVTGSGGNVGGLVGNNDGTVSLSYAAGSVTGTNVVGGLVGGNIGVVNQSYATGSVTGSGGNVGGLVGYNNGTVGQSYATGSVSGSDSVGGLIGNNDGTASQSYASGSVTGSTNVGGLVGTNTFGTISASYWDTQTTGQTNGVGSGTASGATGLTTADARTAAGYASFDFSTVWYQAGDLRPLLRSEAVQVAGVYQVSNLHQLQLMGADLGGSYVLTRNIDAAATNTTAASSGIFGAGGFVPVGDGIVGFIGNLDGAGHTIAGLTIARPSQENVGLIGYLTPDSDGNNGTVTSVGLVGGSITGGNVVGGLVGYNDAGAVSLSYTTGNVSGVSIVGGLVGYNGGNVTQSYATGSVTGSSAYVGGLVGYNGGGTVNQSYATGGVTGSDYVGGLVGYSDSGTVSQSYATGSVTGSDYVGGLIGFNSFGTVSQSYATGSVTGSDYVGGLVGLNFYGTVSETYATGNVTAGSATLDVGGLIGNNSSGTITASYWDTQTTGQPNGGNGVSSGATGLTTADARGGLSNYAGFDPSVWYQAGDMRPILLSEAVQVGGVYQVSNLHQLQLMGADLSGSYVLTRDIDATATASTDASSGIFGAGGFVPVGTFTGSLSGASHTITGLTIARPSQDYVGLIGNLYSSGSVSGLDLIGGSVSGHALVGGLVGANAGTVSQSTTTGSVSGSDNRVGGLVGANVGTVSQSTATGSVSGGGDDVGGLVGMNFGTVSQSNATGSVSGSSYLVGGLVGYNAGTVTQSSATGSVSGALEVGGLVGVNSGTVSQVYATGSVSSSSGQVGGLVGHNSGGTVSQSYATGSVSTSSGLFVGGLAGVNDNGGTVSQSYAIGSVTSGGGFVAGLIGFSSGTITASYWNTETTNQTNGVGPGSTTTGFARRTTAQMQDLANFRTNYAGFDFANVWAPPNQAGQGGQGTAYYPQLYSLSHVLVATPASATRVYGDANPAITTASTTYSGLRAGDFVTSLGAVGTTAAPGSNVGGYAITGSGAAVTSTAGNSYRILYAPGTLSVTPVPLAVTLTGTRAYDGTTDAAASILMITNVVSGDTVHLSGTGTLAGAGVGGQALASTNGTLTGLSVDNTNYTVAGGSGSVMITARPLTITANGQSRAYGDANPSLSYTVGGSGLVNNDTLGGSLATVAATTSDVGAYAITQGTLAASANYALTYAGANLAVGQRAVTVTADGQSRAYGDANPSLTYSATSLGAGAALTGVLATSATATSDVGSYAINAGTLTGAANPNYALTYAGANLAVGQRAVTVTADGQSRAYGDANPSLTYSASSLGAGAALTGVLATSATATSDVGSYAITAGTLTGAANPNYALTYTGANLAVGQRAVTVTADGQSRAYGDANPSLTYTASSLGAGAALTGVLATSATATSDVGSYAITAGTLTGAANPNYALTYAGANLTVGQRAVTVTADGQSRAYGDANPNLTYSATSLGAGAALTGVLATSATATSDVGSYAITAGTLTGAANPNYALTYAGANLAVGQRAVTVMADGQSRAYGDANSSLTYSATSLGAGAALTGVLATSATATSDVGSYAITAGTLTGAANPNYALTYAGANLAVGQRAVTVTADGESRAYGDANPSLTYSATSLGAGAALTGVLATSATATSDVGSYAITAGTLTGAANPNYALTYAGANLAVGQRAITVTADGQSRAYGDANPSLTYSATSLGAGAALSGTLATDATTTSNVGSYAITAGTLTGAANPNYALTYTGANLAVGQRAVTVTADGQSRAYGDANPTSGTATGDNFVNGDGVTSVTLASSATGASGIGSYGLTGSAATGTGLSNYAISYATISSGLSVTPRALTITANAQSRAYGDANPSLTYALGGSGLVNNDTLGGSLATGATTTSDVGAYAITQGTLAASANYAVTYAGANLTVNQRALTVTADAQSRTYGDTNPALTYMLGGQSLANGDALTGRLATSATVTSPAGSYGITQGDLAASLNYRLSYVGALLTVQPAVQPPSVPQGGPMIDTGALASDTGALASEAVRDGFDWIALPERRTPLPDALPLSGELPLTTAFYNDPRFDGILVCFNSAKGVTACIPAGR